MAAGHRSRRCGPTIASSRRTRSPTRASSPSIGSRIGSTTRFRRTDSGKSSSGSARLPRRRSAPATADRRRATASCKWERRGDRILLRSVSYEVVADAVDADREGGPGGELRLDPHGLQHRGHGQRRRAGDRGHAPLHDRRAGVQRPDPRAGADLRHAHARSSSAPSRSRRTSRSKPRTPTTIHRTAPGRQPARAGAGRTRRSTPPASGSSSVVMHYSMVLLPEKPMQPRLFDERVGYFSVSQMDYGKDEQRAPERPLHHAVSSGEEGSERGAVRAGQADRLLDRSGDADQVGAVPEARDRELAAGVRSGRIQERHRREGGADARAGCRLESGGRALLGDPLAAVDDRERRQDRTFTIRGRARSSRRTSSSTTTS